MKYVILLTACINPRGMIFTKLSNIHERRSQYVNAVNFYLKNTALTIVLAENSGTDMSCLFEKEIKNGRLEVLTFSGNTDKLRGKGYGEVEIIEYAIKHSQYIDDFSCIIKITGRLIVENIKKLVSLRRLYGFDKFVQFSTNSEFSFSDSRLIIAPVSFFRFFLHMKSYINDTKNIYFEHVLLQAIKRADCKFCYFPLTEEPKIIGFSGSTGEKYVAKSGTFYLWLVYFNYQLRIVINHPNYSLKRMSHIKANMIYFWYYMFTLDIKAYRFYDKINWKSFYRLLRNIF